MPKKVNLKNTKIGRWIVLEDTGKRYHNSVVWLCRCDCGTIRELSQGVLKKSRSCGCLRDEKVTTHGHKRRSNISSTYYSWCDMKQRCYNPNNASYDRYGKRGITVCERWVHSFENFLEDMGEKPEGLTLDRINNDGRYEPNNCKWSTPYEQAQNRHTNNKWTVNR